MSSVGRRRFFFLFSLFSPRLRQAEVRRFVLHLVLVCFIFCTQFFLRERWGRGECFPLCFWRGEERDRVWRNKQVQVEKEKKKPFFFPSLSRSLCPSSPKPNLLLSPRRPPPSKQNAFRRRSRARCRRDAVVLASRVLRARPGPPRRRRQGEFRAGTSLSPSLSRRWREEAEIMPFPALAASPPRRASPQAEPTSARSHRSLYFGGAASPEERSGLPARGALLPWLASLDAPLSVDRRSRPRKKKRFLTSFPTSPRPAAWSRSARRTPPRSSRPPRPRARSTPSTPTSTPCR